MKAMFVNSDGCVNYAMAIVGGYKPIETRSRNMLRDLVGERVAVVRTRRGKKPMVVGTVFVSFGMKCTKEYLEAARKYTLIPEGSKYDSDSRGKWGYWLCDPERCEPYPLPASAIRHGRSWCEF